MLPHFRVIVSFVPGTVISFSLETGHRTLEFSALPSFSLRLGKFPIHTRLRRGDVFIARVFVSPILLLFSSTQYILFFLSRRIEEFTPRPFFPQNRLNKGEKDAGNNSASGEARCSSRVYSTCHSRFAVTIVICNGNPSHILPIVAKTFVSLSLPLSLPRGTFLRPFVPSSPCLLCVFPASLFFARVRHLPYRIINVSSFNSPRVISIPSCYMH